MSAVINTLKRGIRLSLALLVAYFPAGFQDEVGHGTHVTGTVAGSPLWVNESSSENDPNMAKGTAPGAKIAFFGGYCKASPLMHL